MGRGSPWPVGRLSALWAAHGAHSPLPSACSPSRGSRSARSPCARARRAPPTGASRWTRSSGTRSSGRARGRGGGSGSSTDPSISRLRTRTASTSRCGPSSGRPGLALVLVGLLVPLVAAVRARRQPLAPAVTAAYAAILLRIGDRLGLADQRCAARRHSAGRRPARHGASGRGAGRRARAAWRRGSPATALVAVGAVAWAGGHFTSGAAEHLRAARWEDARQKRIAPSPLAPWSRRLRTSAARRFGRKGRRL